MYAHRQLAVRAHRAHQPLVLQKKPELLFKCIAMAVNPRAAAFLRTRSACFSGRSCRLSYLCCNSPAEHAFKPVRAAAVAQKHDLDVIWLPGAVPTPQNGTPSFVSRDLRHSSSSVLKRDTQAYKETE
jgi:hypothetical protein